MKQHLQIDKYPIFIPDRLNIEHDLENYGDKKLKSHINKFKYLIHLLYVTPLTNRRYYKILTATTKSVTKRIHIPLSGKRLSYMFGERYYKKILDVSKELKYIESTDHWIIGEKSIGYRLTKNLRNQTYKRDHITSPILIRKILQGKSSYELDEVGRLLFDKLKELDFDFDSAKQYLNDCINDGTYQPLDVRYLSRKLMIDSWKYQGIRAKVDNKGFRLHTNLTNLAKELRQYLSWQGNKLVGIDISNSQPFFLIGRLIEYYHPSNKRTLTTYYDEVVPFDSKILIDSISNMYQSILTGSVPSYDLTILEKLPPDVQNYIYLTVTGKLYDTLLELKNREWESNNTREEIKTNVLTLFYQKEIDDQTSKLKEVFKFIFPNVFKYIEISKRRDYRNFPISLQRAESDMILRTICKRILGEQPDIPIFTIHDSIFSIEEHIPYIKKVINEEIFKKYSILPNLKVESYP